MLSHQRWCSFHRQPLRALPMVASQYHPMIASFPRYSLYQVDYK
nr:MAG TPA: hypothetical protein [Caudoviricetes sp.]